MAVRWLSGCGIDDAIAPIMEVARIGYRENPGPECEPHASFAKCPSRFWLDDDGDAKAFGSAPILSAAAQRSLGLWDSGGSAQLPLLP